MNTLHVGHLQVPKTLDFENKAKFIFCTYPQFEKEARGNLGMAFLVHSFHFFLTMLTYS